MISYKDHSIRSRIVEVIKTYGTQTNPVSHEDIAKYLDLPDSLKSIGACGAALVRAERHLHRRKVVKTFYYWYDKSSTNLEYNSMPKFQRNGQSLKSSQADTSQKHTPKRLSDPAIPLRAHTNSTEPTLTFDVGGKPITMPGESGCAIMAAALNDCMLN